MHEGESYYSVTPPLQTTVIQATANSYVANISTGGGVSLSKVSWPAYDGAAPVQPILQAQDGSYIGTALLETPFRAGIPIMVSFNQSGTQKWSVNGNYQPQIATADGGVIATTPAGGTVKFEANGNATGQLGSAPVRSWVNNSYSSGESAVTSIAAQIVKYAQVFTAIAGGNRSQNGTSVQEEWFPELPSCPTVPPGNSPCPREAIRDALAKLRAKVSTNCPACDMFVFSILGRDRTQFYKYLSRAPRLFDGTRSNLPAQRLCGLAEGLQGFSQWIDCLLGPKSGTVSQYMAGVTANKASSALSQTPSDNGEGPMIFFDPRIICNITDGGAKEVLNEAMLFHEAIHGLYGFQDPSLESSFSETTNPGITYYLENNVFGTYLNYLHDVVGDAEPMQCPN